MKLKKLLSLLMAAALILAMATGCGGSDTSSETADTGDTSAEGTSNAAEGRDLAKERKIPGRTAIPAGVYEVIVNISPRFRRKLPRLLDVPGFDGILIHRGNTAEDTSGCILVGENRERGKVINSTRYEVQLTGILERAQEKGKITIEIIQS